MGTSMGPRERGAQRAWGADTGRSSDRSRPGKCRARPEAEEGKQMDGLSVALFTKPASTFLPLANTH